MIQVNLETELLKLEKESADVTHKFYLSKFTRRSPVAYCYVFVGGAVLVILLE